MKVWTIWHSTRGAFAAFSLFENYHDTITICTGEKDWIGIFRGQSSCLHSADCQLQSYVSAVSTLNISSIIKVMNKWNAK
jgi:hypothetical protein